jgi:hypothetical protein
MPEPPRSGGRKQVIAQRAQDCCEYCLSQAEFSPTSFSMDHIIARVRGGSDDLSNLALSCQSCNNFKYTSIEAFDSVNGELVPLFHPRQHPWSDHFTWNHDATLMIGLTATGRATIKKIQLNRPGVVNLRRVLVAFGRHPPSGDEMPRRG